MRLLPVLLVMNLWPVTAAWSQKEKVDTRHLSEKAFCVVRIDVGRMKGHLNGEMKKELEKLMDVMVADSFDGIRELQVLTLQFSEPDINDREPGFVATMEFSKGVDRDSLLQSLNLQQGFEEATHNGKTYLKPDSKYQPSVYFESEKKFSLATPGAILEVLEGGSGMGKIASQVKSAPSDSEVIAVFLPNNNFDAMIPGLVPLLEEMPLPIQWDALIKQAKSGIAHVRLASGMPIRIQLNMETEEFAASFGKKIQSLITLGKSSLPPARAMLKGELERLDGKDGFEAMQRNMVQAGLDGLETAEKILDGAKSVQQGKSLDIQVRHMGGLKELAGHVLQGLKATLGVSSAVPDVVPEID